jgi:hypothetical protein
MAQFRPFAIKTGLNVPEGTDQYQNILVGVDQQNYNDLEYDWVAGPDEDLGYVIAFYDADGDTFRGARIGIENCFIGFLRSELLTDGSFLELVNYMRANASLGSVNTTTAAKTWLVENGYWTSFGEEPWAYGNQEETPTFGFSVTIDQVDGDVVMEFLGSLNINDLTLVSASETLVSGGLGENATFLSGPNNSTFDIYAGSIVAPSSFGNTNGLSNDFSMGSVFGVITPGQPPHQ